MFFLFLGSPAAVAQPRSPLCTVAADYSARGQPQQAMAIIRAARSDAGVSALCGREAALAAIRIETAARLVGRAKAERTAPHPDWAQVQADATEALAEDQDTPDAEALQTEAKKHLARTDPLSGIAPRQLDWDAFVGDVVEPLGKLVSVGLLIAAALVVLARVVAFVWPATYRVSGRRRSATRIRPWTSGAQRGLARAAGLTGLLIAIASPWWLRADRQHGTYFLFLAATIIAYVVTVLSWALVLAARMRMSIEVRHSDGKADEAASTQIIALLTVLGAEAPQGLEVPRGTDVDILDGQKISSVKAEVLQTVLEIIRFVVGITPWRVVVDTEKDGCTHAVMTRNGKSVAAAVVDSYPLGPGKPVIDPHKMVAAFILATMSRAYRDGFAGLADATDWHSIGWTYVATTDLTGKENEEHRKHLLYRAVDKDPKNLLAQIALRRARYRHSTDPKELKAYAEWLNKQSDQLKEKKRDTLPSLRARLMLTASAVELNRHQLNGQNKDQTKAKEYVGRLVAIVCELDTDSPLRASLEPVVGVLVKSVELDLEEFREASEWYNDLDRSIEARFDEACRMLEIGLECPEESKCRLKKFEKAAKLLEFEALTPDFRQGMADDPYLRELLRDPGFRSWYPVPARTDMLEFDPFRPFAAALRNIGYTTAADVLDGALTDQDLGYLLGRTSEVARRLRDAARLAQSVPLSLADFRYEIFAVLWAEGVRRTDDLVGRPSPGLAEAIETALVKRGLDFPRKDHTDLADLETWLASFIAREEVDALVESGVSYKEKDSCEPVTALLIALTVISLSTVASEIIKKMIARICDHADC